jgi:hypothetical protein
MLERREKCIELPDTICRKIVLDKYQATEQRLIELKK